MRPRIDIASHCVFLFPIHRRQCLQTYLVHSLMFFSSSSWQALSYVLKQFRWCCVYKTSASNSFAIWMKSCDLCNGLECISDSWSNSKNKYVVHFLCNCSLFCTHFLWSHLILFVDNVVKLQPDELLRMCLKCRETFMEDDLLLHLWTQQSGFGSQNST